MWERIASVILTRYLGDYLEGISSDHLKLSLLSGAVEFENVILKKSILRQFAVPLDIKEGWIDKVQVNIPWLHLASQPTVITLEGIYLVINPVTTSEVSSLPTLHY